MNNETLIERHFARIGVEAVLVEGEAISIDVRRRAKDELFVLAMPQAAEVKLLDANRPTGICCCSSTTGARKAVFFAVTTSGTGLSPRFPKTSAG